MFDLYNSSAVLSKILRQHANMLNDNANMLMLATETVGMSVIL